MADITLEQAQRAYSRLADNWYHDEEKYYSCEYDVEDPESIPTNELESCDYKNLRVIEDFLYKQKEEG